MQTLPCDPQKCLRHAMLFSWMLYCFLYAGYKIATDISSAYKTLMRKCLLWKLIRVFNVLSDSFFHFWLCWRLATSIQEVFPMAINLLDGMIGAFLLYEGRDPFASDLISRQSLLEVKGLGLHRRLVYFA